jgi:fluoride exporter
VSEAVLLAGVGLVGAVGALARFLLDGAVARRLGRGFPYGTLAVNLSGAFALGVLVGATLEGDAYELAGTGLLGAYTTFSTWMLESHRLAEEGEVALAARNVAASLVLGLAAAYAGRRLGGLL